MEGAVAKVATAAVTYAILDALVMIGSSFSLLSRVRLRALPVRRTTGHRIDNGTKSGIRRLGAHVPVDFALPRPT
jgi:hypothetical protein